MDYLEQNNRKFGWDVIDLLADKRYSTIDNRKKLKEKGINLVG